MASKLQSVLIINIVQPKEITNPSLRSNNRRSARILHKATQKAAIKGANSPRHTILVSGAVCISHSLTYDSPVTDKRVNENGINSTSFLTTAQLRGATKHQVRKKILTTSKVSSLKIGDNQDSGQKNYSNLFLL